MILPHHNLPSPFDRVASILLLEDIPHADSYLMAAIVVLLSLIFVQLRAFSRPPPVPLKKLPKRPAISILFQPDDISSKTHSKRQAKSTLRGSNESSTANMTDSLREQARSLRFRRNDALVEDVPLEELENEDPSEEESSSEEEKAIPFAPTSTDLPDSFAPLLSSSHVELLTNQLTADLIHAVRAEAGLRLQEGRHEVPLDKDASRPQLQLLVPKGGCRVSASVVVGSDGFTTEEDLDVTTVLRSKPMVKQAGLVLDPPLPLSNVAPTLIHFPTLFEDKFVPKLRRVQIIRLFFDLIISISSFLEKCLWIIESKCQIHLSKIMVTPVYKGKSSLILDDDWEETNGKKKKGPYSPEWRLSLSFSGHVLLFGFLPIPFINVTLPTVIIPHPHALLEFLLTPQPLASARLRRENIAEEKIALALIHMAESWNVQIKMVATPPAVGVDVTLPGGVAVAMEMGLGRDPHGLQNRPETDPTMMTNQQRDHMTVNSMSSWTTHVEASESDMRARKTTQFDANSMVPWSLEFAAKGTVSREKLSFHILKLSARHEDYNNGTASQVAARGSFAIWKVGPEDIDEAGELLPLRKPTPLRKRISSFSHPELQTDGSPSVASILLFPNESAGFRDELRLLQYDYVFDVQDNSSLDAITVSVGATHPMLNGGTMVTSILDTIYAYGSISAREKAVLDPKEMNKKRNILRHLPATDFHFGIQNIFIPPESESYSDDGQTLFLPKLEKGQMRIHVLGGMEKTEDHSIASSIGSTCHEPVEDGIRIVADFEAPSLHIRSEGPVKEFPELDIFDGVKLKTNLHGMLSGSLRAHLRPQHFSGALSTTGPNVFNPLEAYEIDFSGSTASIKMKEYTISTGHRRIIFPSESTFVVDVIESVVDMGFEGKTQCELAWDFQGLSPILQVTSLGQSPEDALPENKQQVAILVAPLRQGRISFHVSSVGGISIKKAATSREDKEGLYDWKFFNALVSPDEESASRILDVLHDKRTMTKLLQVIKIVSDDLHSILQKVLEEIWRAKEILDKEGVSDPKHAIPMYKMSRLVSLFLTGGVEEVDQILPIVKRVVEGEGLDVVKVKEILRDSIDKYDEWAPEFDRAIRWMSVALGAMSAPHSIEEHVLPLSELPYHAEKFVGIPSASDLYSTLRDKPLLPLDPEFSGLVSQIAPYLTFKQVEFILQSRNPTDWQSQDLRRIRYVYSIKRKVLEIAESYGGLSFLPQSFFLSVFLGEATRSSHRAKITHTTKRNRRRQYASSSSISHVSRLSTNEKSKSRSHSIFGPLRRHRVEALDSRLKRVMESVDEEQDFIVTPAERAAKEDDYMENEVPHTLILQSDTSRERFELGDSLLGPQDVATLLQAGLTSVMKSSTVVQLNQRMLLDLICSQPRSFAIAVLAEIGSPSGQGSARNLTSALMALLELDQTSFKTSHQIDMHDLLDSWFPGLKMPRREDYMAGGRWARQSYYEALFSVAKSILDDAETYMALKGHVQRVRHKTEPDPLPKPKAEIQIAEPILEDGDNRNTARVISASTKAQSLIARADAAGKSVLESLIEDEEKTKLSKEYAEATASYQEAFDECAKVLALDKHAFHVDWFRSFYKRNYDALMIKSMFDNVMENTDHTRRWLNALRIGGRNLSPTQPPVAESANDWEQVDDVFMAPERHREQVIVDAIIDATIYEEKDREKLRSDPLVRLLIPNRPGKYNFVIVSAMGVITEGKKGLELQNAFHRLKEKRGVEVIRADTATARSFEYNASRIEEAIEAAVAMKKPFGLLGYSQGCANVLMAESMLYSGSPKQQSYLSRTNGGLVCRQLLFSAANGSFHGPAMEKKIQRLIVMCEDFFKYQQGYVSRALSSFILDALNSLLDSSQFHKAIGGAQSFLADGCRAFWREAQHLDDVPTCTLKGVLEKHTTPESLEMISNLLTKQSGSALHDSQVHVFDAVGYPVYHHNRNGRVLKKCAVGEGAIQRTHHWSPLSDEVEFVRTSKDYDLASFDCAKDRHVFPWVDVNARFGFIQYMKEGETDETTIRMNQTVEVHPNKLKNGGQLTGSVHVSSPPMTP
ncbi:hypothetical protein FisN_2Hh135 [Fistulifera solaris]|uniref:Uncharacterized protein n=1 Tax=Fistulifera solaris TaxID=1519565 RepID=A0A1Z5KPF2_FISSO|nr:hypothetical protein FisN_2Hh135 [Fistulifera solaris]|eukprot:GAX28047.1 hypothetical protein FisN_2Hh135 [Fistulifera solaris]